MSKRIAFFILMLFSLRGFAQIPTSCFEIESILVDACDPTEGANEMIRLRIGPAPLNVSNFSASWPNVSNNWLGVCQNANTAAKVAAINASIQRCGLLIEPTGGVLPAGARVIFITSEDMDPLANSFANLSDTLYAVFQCSGNTAGHFVNFGPSSTRTLTMTFSSPAACTDAVTYNRAQLMQQDGTTGSEDGGAVEYAWNGTPTYYNNGCTAPIIPLLVDAGNDTSICPGSTVQLNGSEQASSGIFWTSTQGTFSDTTILNPVFTPNGNATYPIEAVLNAYTTCGDTIADTMLINRLAGAVNAGNDATICLGQSTQLTGSGSNTYSWATSTGTFVSNQQSPTVTPAATTTYVLTGSFGANNCPDTDTVVITVNARDSIVIVAADDSICSGSSTVLTASGGSSYAWLPNNGTLSATNIFNPTATPLITTTYTVSSNGACADTNSILITVIPADSITITASPNTFLCAGESIQLNATGGTGYLWSPNDGTISNVNIASPIVTPTATATYFVVSTGDCPGNGSIIITVIPDVTIRVTATDTIICAGDSIQLTVTGGSDYQWTPDDGSLSSVTAPSPTAIPLGTTTYTVISGVCPDTASILITVNPLDVISVTASDTLICEGNTVQLNATGATGFQWTPNDGSLSDVNAAAPTAIPTSTTTYTATSNGTCPGTASVTITVLSTNPLVVSPDTSACAGDDIQLNASGGSSYQWTPATGLSCTDCANPVATLTDSITYSVSDSGGCAAPNSVDIAVSPVVTITVSPNVTIFRGDSTTLTAAGGSDYIWSPSAGLSATSGNSVFAFPDTTTTYSVTEDGNVCATTALVTVTVELRQCAKALLPTAFSPNNDSENETFGLINPDDYSSVEMRIFNRWGEEVFHTLSASGRWDGTCKGEQQPISTFVYTLVAVCENTDNKDKLQLNGCVTLVR